MAGQCTAELVVAEGLHYCVRDDGHEGLHVTDAGLGAVEWDAVQRPAHPAHLERRELSCGCEIEGVAPYGRTRSYFCGRHKSTVHDIGPAKAPKDGSTP